jgi:hypothetical protein
MSRSVLATVPMRHDDGPGRRGLFGELPDPILAEPAITGRGSAFGRGPTVGRTEAKVELT